jgi:hypothetical protein
VLAAVTATGFPAVLVVLGTVTGIVGIVLCTRDRSEIGTKWLGVGLGLLALGIVLAALL